MRENLESRISNLKFGDRLAVFLIEFPTRNRALIPRHIEQDEPLALTTAINHSSRPAMYPLDVSRYNIKPGAFQHLMATNIYPVQTTDSNVIFLLDPEEFAFNYLGSRFIPDFGIRISRTPLSPTDPSTYAAMSKFTEYNLRKYHSGSGAQGSNQLDRTPLTVPKDLIATQSEGKNDILLMGSMLNPLIADCFKPVHLIPGCITKIVTFSSFTTDHNISAFSNKLFGGSKKSKMHADAGASTRYPKNSLMRNNSTFIDRIQACDGHAKKLSNSNQILISAHGRVLSVIALEDNTRDIDVEPPCLKLIISSSVVTCMAVHHSHDSQDGKNINILVGFASGDILWFNPNKMKYSRWNKNGKIKGNIVTSLEWSKCGTFAFVGFEDGEVLIFNKNYEDPETDYKPKIKAKHKYLITYRSLKLNEQYENTTNLLAHYKLTKKSITSIRAHPTYQNILVLTSDDGFIRLFDMLTESVTDVLSTFYAGALTSEFSPDGKYLFIGGEDDTVSVYEFHSVNLLATSTEEGLVKMICRLQGAKSWVRGIQVLKPTGSQLNYIVGTASDDGFIRFYEFQPRNMRKLKKSANVASHSSVVNSPKFQMNRAFSSQSFTPSLDSRKKKLSNKSSNTLDSLNSSNRPSLMEMINTASSVSYANSQQNPIQTRLGEGFITSTSEKDTKKLNAMALNYIFKKMGTSPQSILYYERDEDEPNIFVPQRMNTVTNILPVSEKDVRLGRLFGLHISKDSAWAFASGGDLIKWKIAKQ